MCVQQLQPVHDSRLNNTFCCVDIKDNSCVTYVTVSGFLQKFYPIEETNPCVYYTSHKTDFLWSQSSSLHPNSPWSYDMQCWLPWLLLGWLPCQPSTDTTWPEVAQRHSPSRSRSFPASQNHGLLMSLMPRDSENETLLGRHISRLILGLRPANEIRRYKVTPSLIGWTQT